MNGKLLVVDDHPETLSVVAMTLERHGYDVLTAQSGPEGLSVAQMERPDLVLLDLNMPGMDGYEVCRRIRKDININQTPIIMFTSMSAAKDKFAGFAAGADDYLAKPTHPQELVRRVQAILARRVGTGPLAATRIRGDSRGPAQEAGDESPGQAEDDQRGELIAIYGTAGGSGATTTAINLAYSLAEIGQTTSLIDLDIDQGHMGWHLGIKQKSDVNSLAELDNLEWERQLKQQTINLDNNLNVLLVKPTSDFNDPILSPSETTLLLNTLRQDGRCVVADLGRGLTPANYNVLQQATQIIVCIRPDRVAILGARDIISQLRSSMKLTTPVRPLLISFTGRSSFPLLVIQDFIGERDLEMIHIPHQDLTKAVNKGQPYIRSQPQADASKKFRQLAHSLVVAGSGR